ncbi:MAG TPA: hypothetical protein VGK21_03720, partial [Candidatus Angelobacter sp.]
SPSPPAAEESQPQALPSCAKSIKRLPGFGPAALQTETRQFQKNKLAKHVSALKKREEPDNERTA